MLELSDLHRRFGDVVALDGVSLAVRAGEMLGFVGRNGAGKTTTMRIALGLVEADHGEVRWQGRAITDDDRRRFGYLPEERGLYPRMTVTDQLVYFARMSGMAAGPARSTADRWIERLGLGERRKDKVEKLSLGNQQRVQLAVALVPEPELLVLDEPFSGLDPVGVDMLAEILKEEVARGAACVFSSHQLELVERLCHAVTIVDGGRVVASGPIDELRRERSSRRLRVEVEAPPRIDGDGASGWFDDLSGVTVVGRENGTVTFELDEGVDDQVVLDAARSAGPVRHFSRHRPTLTELFREVIRP